MIEASNVLVLFLALCGLGVLIAPVLSERRNPSVLAFIASVSALLLMTASGKVLLSGQSFHIQLWALPNLGDMTLAMDRLSALFVFVTGLVFLPASIFSATYMGRYFGRYNLKTFSMCYHLLFGSVVLVLLAGDIVSFLLSWEVMSIFAYLLVNFEHEREETTRSGFLMLAMGEGGTVAAALAFLIIAGASGKLDFVSLKAGSNGLGVIARWAVFLLAFFGFGVKAGLVPSNSWLPRAHPVAAGNVSALLSGIILNLGIYGIVRVNGDLLPIRDLGPGLIVLVVGSVSALVGILYATTENDMKKMLAHSSIENMGIITAGLGAGFVFMASGFPILAGIAFIAAFYHLVNHSLYKSLLFLGAGAIDSWVGNRDMDRLGGMIRRMPWTALFFLAGTLSIAALPPFNGFVSEWLTLQTMLQSAALSSAGVKIVFALCGAGLALTAGLAVTCFVKAFSMSFLGMARSKEAKEAREHSRSMIIPTAMLAIFCLLLGVLPTYVIPVLDGTVSPLVHESVADELVPPFFTVHKGDPKFGEGFVSEFHDLGAQTGKGFIPGRGLVVLHRGSEKNPVVFAMSTSYSLLMLVLLTGGAFVVVRVLTRQKQVKRQPAWDGGVRKVLPEMTYTATAFSNPVRVVFNAIFRPSTMEDTRETVAEHFRTAIKNGREEIHIVDRSIFQPMVRLMQSTSIMLGRMHSGSVNVYAAYVVVSLIAVLVIQLLS
ncbi:MAG TPA: proton-conducting transporter membrane subunit [Syntrophorhabdales bacterium]|nr:proton-conducting transporter membrane subunit [Syntrophorhabdales bacterium]